MEVRVLAVVGWVALIGACVERDDGQAARLAVAAVLDDWHDAAAKADEARYFGHLSDDAVFLGTDASERWDKAAFRAYSHPHFAKGKAWAFRAVRRDIVVRHDVDIAWFDEDLATANLGPARGSGVLVRRAGRWQIAQYNLALTIPNERFDLVKAATTAEVLAAAAADPLAGLAWLAGSWIVHQADGTAVEETWSAPRGATMIGSGRATKGGLTRSFEYLRIELRDGVVSYVAQPLGGAATTFARVTPAVAAGGDEAPGSAVVFENLAHDWPKRIAYRRGSGGAIDVRVEGAPGEPVEMWTYLPAVVAGAQ